jgi:hypothetical protein
MAIDMALLTELAERADGGSIKMRTRIAHGAAALTRSAHSGPLPRAGEKRDARLVS